MNEMTYTTITMREKIYTVIASCGVCSKELNRAENVPEKEINRITMSAPLMAICPVKSHNTLSDVNFKVHLEFLEQDGILKENKNG